jgi:hypothetical protein
MQELACMTARLLPVNSLGHEDRMARRPTTEELARQILRRIYEDTDGRPMEWRTLVTNKTADAAVELAVDYGWLLIDGDKGICLSDEGRALVRKELS